MRLKLYANLCVFVTISVLLNGRNEVKGERIKCDVFQGNWILDKSYPIYDEPFCPFIEKEFDCIKNGRSDLSYLKFRWQPHGCQLSRFDGQNFLEKLRGKTIMFVGDSLSRNQWLSLLCMIHSSVPSAHYSVNISVAEDTTTYTFTEYGAKVKYNHNLYLVDIEKEKIGRVLKLNTITAGKLWLGIDYIIFNTWHWWNRRGASQPFDYIEDKGKLYKDMDRVVAFGKAVETWGRWVDVNVDPIKTKVIFQGISPSHYNGTDWGQPKAKSCKGQNLPLSTSTYPGVSPPALAVLKTKLKNIKKPVTLLDVTNLSLLRKDGHPSVYGLAGSAGLDCSHWCLAGVPDTWNLLLYNLMF